MGFFFPGHERRERIFIFGVFGMHHSSLVVFSRIAAGISKFSRTFCSSHFHGMTLSDRSS
jgi:hypothetical protein